MKKLILSTVLLALFAILISCSSPADKFLYDPSQETPELAAKYDKMLEEAEPLIMTDFISHKWLGKDSEYKTIYGDVREDRISTFLLSNGQEISFRTSQFVNGEMFGTYSIVKVVFDDKGKVVRLVGTYFE